MWGGSASRRAAIMRASSWARGGMAAGRGARLLVRENEMEAREFARRLDGYNAERRQIEEQVQAAAIAQFEGPPVRARMAPGLAFAAARGWHAGVIGIVASRLKERYGR